MLGGAPAHAVRLDTLPWARLAGPLAAADDGLARLDERLRTSDIQDGFISGAHFQDACACLWLAGELVAFEDLVLHDARMDIRSPTRALTRAQAVLRTRRRIAGAAPEWALTAVHQDQEQWAQRTLCRIGHRLAPYMTKRAPHY